MTINFKNALGLHPDALVLREQRSQVLAANLANADTPGYKARDMDFKAILKRQMPQETMLDRTQADHMTGPEYALGGQLKYRNPNQVSLDGNTVEEHIEQAKYAENALQYQASLTFINNKLAGLMSALKG
jgi:flagellar basal-body rod protein FlgB